MSTHAVTGDKIAEVLEAHREGGTVELILAVEAGFEALAAALAVRHDPDGTRPTCDPGAATEN